jgi:hypothetical protein
VRDVAVNSVSRHASEHVDLLVAVCSGVVKNSVSHHASEHVDPPLFVSSDMRLFMNMTLWQHTSCSGALVADVWPTHIFSFKTPSQKPFITRVKLTLAHAFTNAYFVNPKDTTRRG